MALTNGSNGAGNGAEKAANDAIEHARKPRAPVIGRLDHDGQEMVIKMRGLRDNLSTLVDLYKTIEDYKADLNSGIKDTAEQCGLQASVVLKVVKAKANETFEEKAREARQLSLVFEELSK